MGSQKAHSQTTHATLDVRYRTRARGTWSPDARTVPPGKHKTAGYNAVLAGLDRGPKGYSGATNARLRQPHAQRGIGEDSIRLPIRVQLRRPRLPWTQDALHGLGNGGGVSPVAETIWGWWMGNKIPRQI